ncbi:MAG: hypothetical protein ABFS12_08590 [Bacteroidota bacterium]
MRLLKIITIILSLGSISFGQRGAFSEFNTSRYARVVALGNAFTGLADDIEAVYYNSAGLANLDYYSASYSNGHGYAFVFDDYTASNFALLLPTFNDIGKFALSATQLKFNLGDNFSQNLYRLHFARNILDNFSIGASINYYHISADSYSLIFQPDGVDKEFSGNAFDISLSALYSLPIEFIPGILNETRFGLQMQNLFDTDVNYSNELDPNQKHQTLRIGASTSIIPKLPTVLKLNPIKFILVADAVYYGSEYDFNLWQPNFGLELKLFEIISLRYGRENENKIGDAYTSSSQHPVKRYGIGLSIPLHKFITDYDKLEISFDYSYSDWDKLDETQPMIRYFSDDLPIRESFSVKAAFQF